VSVHLCTASFLPFDYRLFVIHHLYGSLFSVLIPCDVLILLVEGMCFARMCFYTVLVTLTWKYIRFRIEGNIYGLYISLNYTYFLRFYLVNLFTIASFVTCTRWIDLSP
jgi:hypothetical protein